MVDGNKSLTLAQCICDSTPDAEIMVLGIQGVGDQEIYINNPNISFHVVTRIQEMHAIIGGVGPFDLLIENGVDTGTRKRDLLRSLIYHVADGGRYVVENLDTVHHSRSGGRYQPSVFDIILAAWVAKSGPQIGLGAGDRALSDAVGAIELSENMAIISKSGNHSWKLREEQIRVPSAQTEILNIYPPQEVESRALVETNNAALQESRFPRILKYPEISLRSYANATAVPGQVYFQGSTVLPDSFRHFTRPYLRNRNLKDLGRDVAIGPPLAPRLLPGQFYALDSELPGHFGHITSEVVARLWGWDEAKAKYPELKALVSKRGGGLLAEWEYELFEAAGIDREDIHVHHEPVQVERLIAATPMFSQPASVSTQIVEVWNTIGKKISPGIADGPKKIFIGRKAGSSTRVCRNGADLENKFRESGYMVVYPEDLSIADQISLFRSAQHVAGYAGSGMFNLMFSGGAKDIIVIGSESYDAVNEYLIASALGGNLTYFWCVPDLPQPSSGWQLTSFFSDYEFDFRQDGELLDRVLSQAETTTSV